MLFEKEKAILFCYFFIEENTFLWVFTFEKRGAETSLSLYCGKPFSHMNFGQVWEKRVGIFSTVVLCHV